MSVRAAIIGIWARVRNGKTRSITKFFLAKSPLFLEFPSDSHISVPV